MSTKPLASKPFARRPYTRPVGVLFGNNFTMENAVDIAEDGMTIHSERPITINERILVNFHLESEGYFIIPCSVKAVKPALDRKGLIFETEFTKLSFEYRRALRAYIAAKPVTSYLISKPLKKAG